LVFASWVRGDEDLVTQTEDGKVISVPVSKIALTNRVGKYKPLKAGLKVQSAWIHRRRRNN